ncbi:hypothetical protein [Pararhizobium sp.]|uniref:hypothetical protein n=1 Tax=Pararhizobium sp. TaxID=1977563 RepID=UPI003D0B9107
MALKPKHLIIGEHYTACGLVGSILYWPHRAAESLDDVECLTCRRTYHYRHLKKYTPSKESACSDIPPCPLEWMQTQAIKHQVPLADVRTEDDRLHIKMAWAYRFVSEMWQEHCREGSSG